MRGVAVWTPDEVLVDGVFSLKFDDCVFVGCAFQLEESPDLVPFAVPSSADIDGSAKNLNGASTLSMAVGQYFQTEAGHRVSIAVLNEPYKHIEPRCFCVKVQPPVVEFSTLRECDVLHLSASLGLDCRVSA